MPHTWGLAGGDAIAPGLIAMRPVGGGTAYEAWLAFDERMYAPVIVKVMRPDLVGVASAYEGLLREVDMLRRLNHPGIVRLFGADTEGERPHIVLENIDGPSLSSLIASDGPVQLHQLLPLGLELCSALHYLQAQQICHLDLKPSNVIMGAPAKLIDFSIAMDAKTAADLDHPLGSDEYMAPEQCQPGHLGAVGHASDMWAFGATMFRAAAGYRAYEREPRWAQLTDEPFELPDFVPPGIAEIVYACLADEPGARPSPEQVAQSLEPLIDGLPRARLSGFKIKL